MLLQAKAHTTAADWAQAYAELVKEKDVLVKEKDALTKENDALAKEKNVLVKEKDALAKEKDALNSVTKKKDAQLAALTKEKGELAKEKDALAKENDALTSVTKEKDAQLSVLTKEKDVLAKAKDALANQLSQCNAIGNSTGLFGTLVALVCEALSRLSAHSFCARPCPCDGCCCSGGRRSRDAAEASSRSRCQARAETRAPF